MKLESMKLEKNKDFSLLFGKPLLSTMKRSQIPETLLYSNRTEDETNSINSINQIFRHCIADILLEQSSISKANVNVG